MATIELEILEERMEQVKRWGNEDDDNDVLAKIVNILSGKSKDKVQVF